MAQHVAVVTGTTSGVGEAVARTLLHRGWRVLGIARRASTISDASYDHLRADLRDQDALFASVEPRLTAVLADRSLSRIALVNNAADPAILGPVAALDTRRLAEVFAVNVTAPLWLMGSVVRLAPSAAAVRIVNVSSGAAVRAFPGLAAYGGSKAALRLASMAAAAESDPARFAGGFSVVSYEPGAVDTPMQAHARKHSAAVLPSIDIFVRFAAEGQLVSPEAPAGEIADLIERNGMPAFLERRLGQD